MAAEQIGLDDAASSDGVELTSDAGVLVRAVSGALAEAMDEVGEDTHEASTVGGLPVGDEEIAHRIKEVQRFVALRRDLVAAICEERGGLSEGM